MKYSNHNYFDFKLEDLENYLSESLLMVQKDILQKENSSFLDEEEEVVAMEVADEEEEFFV